MIFRELIKGGFGILMFQKCQVWGILPFEAFLIYSICICICCINLWEQRFGECFLPHGCDKNRWNELQIYLTNLSWISKIWFIWYLENIPDHLSLSLYVCYVIQFLWEQFIEHWIDT